jgi:type I restriction enzyme M protein
MERFEAVSKLLFTKIVDEREAAGTWNGSAKKESEELRPESGDSDRVIYERARAVWHRAIAAHPQVFSGERSRFPRDVHGVARIFRLLSDLDLSATSTDIKGGAYEELLRNTFEKNENQQYFTPRHVVDFMVEMAEPSLADVVCDPACGSGGFLVGALVHASQQDGDHLAFASAMRGIEVDERMAWVARINMLMHGGDPKSIRRLSGAGSLAPLGLLADDVPVGSVDLILTNPPFGSDLTNGRALQALQTGKGRNSRRRGVLFLERCVGLLRPGGRLAIVLDDSVLNLPKNRDVRQLIRKEAIIEAVIGLPDVMFMPYSTAKSSILVLRRRSTPTEAQGQVLMADVEHVGNRPNGDPLYGDIRDEAGNRLLKSDLPKVLEQWRRFVAGNDVFAEFEGSVVFTANIEEYVSEPDGDRLDVYFFHPKRTEANTRLARSRYPLVPLEEVAELDGTAVNPSEEFGEITIRWIGLGEIESHTGRYEVKEMPGDRLRSNAHSFQGGDILLSRLRPKLRKVVIVPAEDEGGLCSGELLVFRVRPGYSEKVSAEYLAHLLRSDLILGQMIYRITGIGRPRVSAGSVRRMSIPLAPLEIQEQVAKELSEAHRKSDELRAEALRVEGEAVEQMASAYAQVLNELFPSDS